MSGMVVHHSFVDVTHHVLLTKACESTPRFHRPTRCQFHRRCPSIALATFGCIWGPAKKRWSASGGNSPAQSGNIFAWDQTCVFFIMIWYDMFCTFVFWCSSRLGSKLNTFLFEVFILVFTFQKTLTRKILLLLRCWRCIPRVAERHNIWPLVSARPPCGCSDN